ncbi:ribosome biogenesis GTPase Der [Bacteroidota bacterium]
MSNIVAIVGRPNVGKSTLFNRLTQTRHAIVHEASGVTRDRHYGVSDWNGHEFSVIDTGGYVNNTDDIFEEEISKQVVLAIDEADVIILVVDVISGITDLDEIMAEILRKSNKKVFVVVNKIDNSQRIYDASVFYGLGLGEIYCVSSINGSGTGDLLDSVVLAFTKESGVDDPEIPRFAVVGRPNVGKSSLINSLIGQERNIVTPIAGTTRDAINTRYLKFGLDFYLVDTAGLRKKGKVQENIEFYSVMRSVRAIESSDVCLIMLDATRGVEAQDVNIFSLCVKNKKGIVVLVNKWDLIDKETNTVKSFSEKIMEKFAPFSDFPIIFVSALTKQRIHKALEVAIKTFNNRKRRISTSALNNIMLEVIEKQPPPAYKGKYIQIKFVTQLPTKTPSFAFFCNLPQYIKDPYKRYLENRLRENFDFHGVPIQIYIRTK